MKAPARGALLWFFAVFVYTRGYGTPAELDCERQLAAAPDAEESAKCFYNAGQGSQALDRVVRRLRELSPNRPWVLFYVGHLLRSDPAQGEEMFRQAADLFAARRDPRGEILARDSRERFLMNLGRSAEAAREVTRAVRVAERSGDPILRLRVQLLEARHLQSQGRDLERAYLLARRAEAALADAPYLLRRDALLLLGNLSLEVGRAHEARATFRRLASLARGNGDRFAEAAASYNLARSLTDELVEMPLAEARNEALLTARQALIAARVSGHRSVEAKTHLLLALLASGEEAQRSIAACIESAVLPTEKSYCLGLEARRLAAKDPVRAQELVEQTLQLAGASGDPRTFAAASRELMRLVWRREPPARAAAESASALEAIEGFRELESASTPELFSTAADDYYWLAGRLFEAATAGGGEALVGQAFDVTERMRSRALIRALEASRATPPGTVSAQALTQRRAATLGQIASVQRRLLDPELPADLRVEARRELERLELEESELRLQLDRASPALSALLRPDFVTLPEVRRALAADEALLSFQVAPLQDMTGDFGGGSWLLVVTRRLSRVYRLADRTSLRPAVSLFDGLVARRDGAEARSGSRFCQLLLGAALHDLPQGVRRLIVVPDDAVHKLPFGALREAPDAEPLALRYEISVVPSATLWLRWRRTRPAVAAIPALALADPPLPGAAAARRAAARERSAVLGAGARFGPLPYARQEGRAAVDQLGGGSVLRLGSEASEAFLKSAPLQRFGILHFATHAVTEEDTPERSGVLLAPGAPDQDGLLQMREIVDLPLAGRTVVLSACSSNTGALLRGEGVMSLARAFFQAGAHAVVASLWPLRDDEAADFFDRFYRHVSRGASLAAALQGAQRELVAAGAPAAAWAGLVVLGDGDLVALPGGRTRPPFSAAWIALLVCVLLVAGALAFTLVHQRRSPLGPDAHRPRL